jgi:coatomer protein complex subunit alpha (xenin)
MQAKKLIYTATQYTVGMSLELERRSLINNKADISTFSQDIQKRALELSAYFTIPEMEPPGVTLALWAAMNFAFKNKQFSSALSFANSLIEKGTNAKFKENVSCMSCP